MSEGLLGGLVQRWSVVRWAGGCGLELRFGFRLLGLGLAVGLVAAGCGQVRDDSSMQVGAHSDGAATVSAATPSSGSVGIAGKAAAGSNAGGTPANNVAANAGSSASIGAAAAAAAGTSSSNMAQTAGAAGMGLASSAGAAAAAPPVVPPGEAKPGGPGLGDETYPDYGNGGYDVSHYDIRLKYTPTEDRLEGTTTITLTPTMHLSSLNLDFLLDVSEVTVAGMKAMFAHESVHELVITPAQPIAKDYPVDVVVKYAGVPSQKHVQGLAIQTSPWWRTRDGAIGAGAPENAWWWFPSNDHPSDKATHDITVTVPDNLSVISNGVQVMPPTAADAGWKTWYWRSSKPQQSYVTLLAIGEFEIVESKTASGLPVTLAYSKHADVSTARMSVDRTAEIVAWEESVFGPYPFEAIGGVVGATDGINYAMEMQTRPIYPTSYFGGFGGGGRSGDSVVAHENAHQWFGDSAAIAHWKDVWLSEGFATYAEWLYSEAHGNGTAQALFDTAYSRNAASAPFWQVVIGNPGASKVYDQAVYDRGAMALHQVRLAVGDDKFYEILRTWTDMRRYGNGSIDDFRALCEAKSGKMLSKLFDDWLFKPGKPQVANSLRSDSGPVAAPLPKSWAAIRATQAHHRPLR